MRPGSFMIVLLLLAGCGSDPEPPAPAVRSPLVMVLQEWREQGALLSTSPGEDKLLARTSEEGIELVEALRHLAEHPDLPHWGPSLQAVGELSLNARDRAAWIIRFKGTAVLAGMLQEALAGSRHLGGEHWLMAAWVLTDYQHFQADKLLARLAAAQVAPESTLWPDLLERLADGHPQTAAFGVALRRQLPSGPVGLRCLAWANRRLLAGEIQHHPFDTPAGRHLLAGWLKAEPGAVPAAGEAAKALAFLGDGAKQEGLLEAALRHPDTDVAFEAAWSAAWLEDPRGLDRLERFATQLPYSYRACETLRALEQEARIPATAEVPAFAMTAKALVVIAGLHQAGRQPDTFQLVDHRDLHWPPTDDRRELWLFRYTYEADGGATPDQGWFLYGAVFPVLVDGSLDKESVYGYACADELVYFADTRQPAEASAEAGLAILSMYNPKPFEDGSAGP